MVGTSLESFSMADVARDLPRLNRLRQIWDEGRTALGVIATIPSVQIVLTGDENDGPGSPLASTTDSSLLVSYI